MLEFNSRIKKWGNSFGLVIPKNKIKEDGIKENEEVYVIAIRKNNAIKESFGMLKSWGVSGQKIKDLIRKDLHNN